MPETDDSHRGQGPGNMKVVYDGLELSAVKNFIMAHISQLDGLSFVRSML